MGRFRFFFFSNEAQEPPHVHVKAGGNEAKFWLDPIEIAVNHGYNARELNLIRGIAEEYREDLLEAWHVHFKE